MTAILKGKQRHADVFRSLQAAAKEMGGLSEVARILGQNEKLINMKFNVNDEGHQPTAIEMLDVIQLTGAHVSVNAIALKIGYVAIQEGSEDLSPGQLVNKCQTMLAGCGKTIQQTATGLADGRLTHDERHRISECLDELIPLLIGVRAAARG